MWGDVVHVAMCADVRCVQMCDDFLLYAISKINPKAMIVGSVHRTAILLPQPLIIRASRPDDIVYMYSIYIYIYIYVVVELSVAV